MITVEAFVRMYNNRQSFAIRVDRIQFGKKNNFQSFLASSNMIRINRRIRLLP